MFIDAKIEVCGAVMLASDLADFDTMDTRLYPMQSQTIHEVVVLHTMLIRMVCKGLTMS